LSQGDKEAGWAHITDVLENLATMVVLAPVFHYTVSPFIEGLKAVTLPSGKTRLWKPDLRPYQRTIRLPDNARPNELGLHRYDGQDILPLDGKHYAVKKASASGQYRVQHPTRPDAYQPELNHNGSGAWNHEVESPLNWEKNTLLRRLGHSTASFTDAELEQIRTVSDIDEDVLRRMHVDSEPMPVLLADTVKRFSVYADAQGLSRQILDGSLRADLCGYVAELMVKLPGWSGDQTLEVTQNTAAGSQSTFYGTTRVPASGSIRISQTELMDGQLSRRVVESLNDAQIKSLLGQHAPQTATGRIEALQKRLAEQAQKTRKQIFESMYRDRTPTGNQNVQLIRSGFSTLPTPMVEALLADADPVQLQQMNDTGRVPAGLAQKARELQQRVRLTRAYEGLYLDGLVSPDTENLILHTLGKLLNRPDDVCIEVREGSLTGALRARVGPGEAPRRKVLVRTGEGQYEARDASDNHLHGRDDMYAALQHALPDAQRQALGLPRVDQGGELGVLIKQKALSRDELRSVLKMQPVNKPFFKPLTVLSDGRRGYPLSGRGQGVWGRAIEDRVRTLYPAFTAEELDEFIESLNVQADSPEDQVKVLEREYKKLDDSLQAWLREPNEWSGTRDSPEFRREWGARIEVIKALKQAWQRTGPRDYDAYGNFRGQTIDLSNTSVQRQLLSLPVLEANFDHVTRVILKNTGFSNEVENFLGHFRQLRALNLANNKLTRLPSMLGGMRHLLELHLGANQIVLTEQAVAQLRQLIHLKVLGMERNPLALVPDISRMRNLHILNLSATGIETWPTGIFALPRPRHFDLRLLNNPITRIPVVAPGSFRAEILARTLISRESQWLSSQNLAILKEIIESVGLDPDRRFTSAVIVDSRLWLQALPPEQRATPQLRELKRDAWGAVADELGSEPFFDQINELWEAGDALTVFRAELAEKVWRMIEAAAVDTSLREKLFDMAAAPTTCADAGTQLFNAMGVEVLVREAYALVNKGLVESELVSLAQGRSRLDELSKIARARVVELEQQGRIHPRYDADGHFIPLQDEDGNFVRYIDEVQIHMTYGTALAERLDLPWQSRLMRFEEPDVTLMIIEAAYRRVLALEEGDLLRDSIIEQDFWRTYIQGSNRRMFKGLRRRIDAALDLQIAQAEWGRSADLSERSRLRGKITALAKVLGKPESDVPPGRVMTDAEYSAELESIEAEKQSLLKKLTQEAMDRAKLQRAQIPFEVESGH
jgi:hypothetical protein